MRPIKKWRLKIQHPTKNEIEVFIIFAMINISRGEVICGRATCVFKVWKESEMNLSESERTVTSLYFLM